MELVVKRSLQSSQLKWDCRRLGLNLVWLQMMTHRLLSGNLRLDIAMQRRRMHGKSRQGREVVIAQCPSKCRNSGANADAVMDDTENSVLPRL
jgi:hypothetical protein